MSNTSKKPQRLDKNGRPYPAKKQKQTATGNHTAKKGKVAKKSAPKPAGPLGASHPEEWLFLHSGDCSVQQLKEIAATIPDLDIEVWPELQIMELTLPNKVFIDFERTEQPPQEPAILALLEQEQTKTLYYVSVEPFCSDPELTLLRTLVEQSCGILVADNDDLSPVIR